MSPIDGPVHTNRARAESFGAAAADYDRFRPDYPRELIDDLLAPRPRTALDIGCGTGKASRLVAARGVAVLGVEIDPEMAAVARAHGLDVETGRFEEWDAAGRRFDLVMSAQAWHWVDPVVAAPKVAGLLTDGGRAAFFWNFEEVDEDTLRVTDVVYGELAPELLTVPKSDPTESLPQLQATGAFREVSAQTYSRRRELAVDEWVGMVGTHSNHLVLGPARLLDLQHALRSALSRAVPAVRLTGGTYTIWARP